MLHASTVSFNRSSNTTAYPQFSVVAPATPSVLVFPVINPRGLIRQINVATNNIASVSSGYRLYLFDAPFAPIADQGTSGLTANMAFDFITAPTISGSVTGGGSAVAYTLTPGQPLTYITPDSNLYGYLRTEGTFTPVADQLFQITLFVDTNNNQFNI